MKFQDWIKFFQLSLQFNRWLSSVFIRWRLGNEYDPLTIEAAVTAQREGRAIEPILAQARRAYTICDRQSQLLRAPPPVHGSARWATADELTQAGVLHDEDMHAVDPGRLVLGHIGDQDDPQRQWLSWNGEGHLLTIAPTRSGKGTTQIIPNLVRYPGSAVVLDPKGELFEATAAWRKQHVGPVYRIAPFADTTDAFNPLSLVETHADATALAEMLLPRSAASEGVVFEDEAINFLAATIYFVRHFAPPDQCSMGQLREDLTAPLPEFITMLRVMAAPTMPPEVRRGANIALGKSPDKALPQLRESLNSKMAIWDFDGLVRATERADFDFRALKDAPATVYLQIPFDQLQPYQVFVQVLLSTALEAMLRNPRQPDVPVLFVLDEFLSLGRFPKFLDATRTHAGAGVRLWFFLQNLPTLESLYPTSWRAFFADTAVKTFFGTDDTHTAEFISATLGDTTLAYAMPNGNAATVGNVTSSAANDDTVQLVGRPLMTAQEVMALLSSQQDSGIRNAIHLLRGVPPCQATLVPWFVDATGRARAHFDAKIFEGASHAHAPCPPAG